jgi:hypothetical protein
MDEILRCAQNDGGVGIAPFRRSGGAGGCRQAAAEPPHSESFGRIRCAVGPAGGPSARRFLVRKLSREVCEDAKDW